MTEFSMVASGSICQCIVSDIHFKYSTIIIFLITCRFKKEENSYKNTLITIFPYLVQYGNHIHLIMPRTNIICVGSGLPSASNIRPRMATLSSYKAQGWNSMPDLRPIIVSLPDTRPRMVIIAQYNAQDGSFSLI